MADKKQEAEFAALVAKATDAGLAALEAKVPVPMIVGQAKDLFSNEIDYTKKTYFEPDGVCGFAWIKFKGNTPFGRWAKKTGLARPDYPTGLAINVREGNQSMQKKEAYADAFAKVLKDAGIDCYADSRLD